MLRYFEILFTYKRAIWKCFRLFSDISENLLTDPNLTPFFCEHLKNFEVRVHFRSGSMPCNANAQLALKAGGSSSEHYRSREGPSWEIPNDFLPSPIVEITSPEPSSGSPFRFESPCIVVSECAAAAREWTALTRESRPNWTGPLGGAVTQSEAITHPFFSLYSFFYSEKTFAEKSIFRRATELI